MSKSNTKQVSGKKPEQRPVSVKKRQHPWRAWNPGQFKRSPAPVAYREVIVGVTKPNRAR